MSIPLPAAMNMQGKRVIVTGAASGIGRATANVLAQLGAELILTDPRGEVIDSIIATAVIDHKAFADQADPRAAFDAVLQKEIDQHAPTWVVLAGFMRILGAAVLEPFDNRIINIHPSLLPALPGLHTHRRALESGTRARLHTDSQYVQLGISTWIRDWKKRGWRTADRKPVKNVDLWRRLDELAGQHADYLVKALQGYKNGTRKNAVMAPMGANLSQRDMEDLAAFFSQQQGLTTFK